MLSGLHAQLMDLLDRCWIQHSTAGHAAAVVFARKPDGSHGTWRICYDYRSLVASTPSRGRLSSRSRTLTHCSTARWGSLFVTKLYLASSYHQLLVWAADGWKTSFRSQPGQLGSTLGGRRLCGPAHGAVQRQIGNANVVRLGAPLHLQVRETEIGNNG